jgi:acyl-CoA thioesterase
MNHSTSLASGLVYFSSLSQTLWFIRLEKDLQEICRYYIKKERATEIRSYSLNFHQREHDITEQPVEIVVVTV